MHTKNKTYKWANPYEWLNEASREWDCNKLRFELMEIAVKLDSDQLQDIYQSDMDQDGYFEAMEA